MWCLLLLRAVDWLESLKCCSFHSLHFKHFITGLTSSLSNGVCECSSLSGVLCWAVVGSTIKAEIYALWIKSADASSTTRKNSSCTSRAELCEARSCLSRWEGDGKAPSRSMSEIQKITVAIFPDIACNCKWKTVCQWPGVGNSTYSIATYILGVLSPPGRGGFTWSAKMLLHVDTVPCLLVMTLLYNWAANTRRKHNWNQAGQDVLLLEA